MEENKNIFGVVKALIAGIMAYLNPISGDVYALIAVFWLNFVFGLLADLCVNDNEWSFRKAWKCISEMMVIFVLMCAIFFIGKQKGNPEAALQCISFISYTVFYFYGVNILRNMKLLFPASRTISFLYNVASIEFAKKIPGLSEYLEKNKQ